jgi:hypothetical protein
VTYENPFGITSLIVSRCATCVSAKTQRMNFPNPVVEYYGTKRTQKLPSMLVRDVTVHRRVQAFIPVSVLYASLPSERSGMPLPHAARLRCYFDRSVYGQAYCKSARLAESRNGARDQARDQESNVSLPAANCAHTSGR